MMFYGNYLKSLAMKPITLTSLRYIENTQPLRLGKKVPGN